MSTTKPLTKALAIAFAAAFAVGLIAKVLPDEDAVDATLPSAAPPTPAAAHSPAPDSVRKIGTRAERDLTRSSFEGAWPLVHDEATIACTPRERPYQNLSSATVVIAGREYRLNGTAVGYPELGALWLDNDTNPGAKVTISDLVEAAVALCAHIK